MNNIFSHFISRNKDDDQKRVGYMMWFDSTYPDSEFSNEDYIMKRYCSYSCKLSVPMKDKYFDVFLSTELKRILISTGVRMPGTDNLSYDDPAGLQEAYIVAQEYLKNEFKILESYESEVDDFKVYAGEFIENRLNDRVVDELSKSYEKLSSSEDAALTVRYALDKLIIINDIYSKEALDDLESSNSNPEGSFEFVCDTGIPVVDADIRGIYTTQMFSIDSQPGAGKTRFALGVWAYRAAVLYKKNVIYYQLEQTTLEARSMLIARHVFTLYGLQISADMIQFNRVPAEYQTKVKAAEVDLFDSGKYGKIFINTTDLYYNRLANTFRKDDKLHGPFNMIIVDYMGLIRQYVEQYQRELPEYEVIARSHRIIKNYVRATCKCAVVVNQFNEKGIEAGKSDKEIQPNMVQGGIAAYRHSDQNLALSCSTVMKAQQKIRISQPKIRGTAGFNTAVIDTRLGFCYFYQNAPQQV